jgi:hypothetical protein
MKKFGDFFFFIFFTLIFILSDSMNEDAKAEPYKVKKVDFATHDKINESLMALEGWDNSPPSFSNGLYIIDSNIYRTGRQIDRMLRQPGKGNGTYIYRAHGAGSYTMSGQGIDGKHHLANSYLVGYQPFEVDNVMMPLYVLSQRKSYMLDEKQYRGRLDVWQSSKEAFYYPRGDCEDHALALADWLIEMGEDARVVVGDWDGGGHAWVILFKNGKEYLLEATKKTRYLRTKPYPVAILHKDYHPQYMFNREYFWENDGTKYTSKYSGSKWKKRSQYHKS